MSAPAATDDRPTSSLVESDTPPRAPGATALVLVVLIAHVLLAWRLRVWGITTTDDDAGYLLLARALRYGQFRELQDPTLPIGAKYPPGYPALLALASLAVGERLDWLLVLSLAASVVALWCLFDVVRREWGVGLALLALVLTALNPYVIGNAGRLMSEAPFMAFMMIALRSATIRAESARAGWVTGASAIVAALVRSAGVTLVAAIELLWLGQRRFRRVVVFGLVSATTVGAWTVWTLAAPNAKERGLYSADAVETAGRASFAGALVHRVRDNVYRYAVDILPAEVQAPTVAGTIVDNVVLVVAITLLLAAGYVPLWRQWRPAALFFVTYALLLAVWTWPVERFLEPVLPLILLTMLLGAWSLGSRVSRRVAWASAAVVALALGSRSVLTVRRLIAAQDACDRRRPTVTGCVTPIEQAFFAATRFVADSLPADAVVATAKTRPFYYYSAHRAVDPGFFLWLPPAQVVPRLREIGADYLLLTELGFNTAELRGIAEGACGSFDLVREFAPTTTLLRLRPAGTPAADSAACRALDEARPRIPQPAPNAAR